MGIKSQAGTYASEYYVMQTVSDPLALIRRGAETVGAAGGAALGGVLAFLSGTSEGTAAAAAAGSLVGTTFAHVVGDIAERVLSERERTRLEMTAYQIAVRTKERVDAGDRPREDGFFERDQTGRSTADEILEGVLLKCKNEFREKKLRYLCNIAANAPFSNASAEMLNNVIIIAEALTYRQLCLFALLARAGEFGFDSTRLRPGALGNTLSEREQRDAYSHALFQLGLYGHGVIDYAPSSTITYNYGGPIQLSSLGRRCLELMGLVDVPSEELEKLIADMHVA